MASSNRLDRASERRSSIHEEGERDCNRGCTVEVVVEKLGAGEVGELAAATAVMLLWPSPERWVRAGGRGL